MSGGLSKCKAFRQAHWSPRYSHSSIPHKNPQKKGATGRATPLNCVQFIWRLHDYSAVRLMPRDSLLTNWNNTSRLCTKHKHHFLKLDLQFRLNTKRLSSLYKITCWTHTFQTLLNIPPVESKNQSNHRYRLPLMMKFYTTMQKLTSGKQNPSHASRYAVEINIGLPAHRTLATATLLSKPVSCASRPTFERCDNFHCHSKFSGGLTPV